MPLKPIQIFKPGRHTALSGAVLEFSAADLAATAAAYDPAKHEAPIVVGHPATDAPAYGWVKGLAFADGALDAQPDQVDAAFAEIVAAGRFKKISASFYAPDAPANPAPGCYYLRHVGFLGAAAPGVKGLRTPSFAADEAGVVEFAADDLAEAPLLRRLGEWFAERLQKSRAVQIVGDADYLVRSLELAARQKADQTAKFAESTTQETSQVTPEEKAALEAENAALKARLSAADAKDKADRAAARHAAHAAFAEPLAAEGKLLPAQVAVAVATLDFLAAQETAVEFGEGEARKPLADAFKDLLQGLPKQVEFSETATRERAGAAAASVEFAAPSGYSVDGDAMARHRKALAHQAQHKTDYVTAIRAVTP